jgi:2-polyprenyl-3-methyl-5-hydroxy-6-metoxy-1,4-benzoquinol methylase
VLDCGCGEGFFASELVSQGNHVVGLDVRPQPKAASALDRYIPTDLQNGLAGAFEALNGMRFSKVLLMDVLEHLVKPELLLDHCKRVLTSNGHVFISVPNVANITVRLMLLLGRFEYVQRGILDRTHVRFFTRRSARRLIESSGYQIVQHEVTVMPLELVLGLSPDSFITKLVSRVLRILTCCLPGLLGYQNVFVAVTSASRESLTK